jgi:hypothetical protein
VEYICKTVPFTNLIASHSGFIKPLCDMCKTCDCTNPIEKRKVSVVGIVKDMRICVKSGSMHLVIECMGFSK